MAKKIYRYSDVMPQSRAKKHDSVKERNGVERFSPHRSMSRLERANQAWENLRGVRERADRTEGYTFGDDQWGDTIITPEGKMTERQYIQSLGNVPLTDNVMISIFSSITGLYDKQQSEPNAYARDNVHVGLSDMMSATVQCNWQNNKVPHTLSVAWRNFLNSGVAILKSTYDLMDDGIFDVNTSHVSLQKAFWEAGTDPNMRDLTLIGQLNDVPKERLYQAFAKPSLGFTVEDIDAIFHINKGHDNFSSGLFDDDYASTNLDQNERNKLDNVSFFCANTPHCYRVIEVWTIESKTRWQCWDPIAPSQEEAYFKIEDTPKEINAIKRINAERRRQCREAGITDEEEMPIIVMEKMVDVFWYYTFMAPDGTVLAEGETPYDHKSHPYSILLFPYVNGKIYPFMSFIIDEQRNINRLNIMNDLAIRSATKGLTIYPEDIIPDDMTPEQFDDQLTSYHGVVRYKLNKLSPQSRPEILTSNAANLGIHETLQMKINMMQQVANVSGALQGKTPTAGTSAARYSMEAENSTTSLFTLINDFSGLMEDVALKNCELIKQFYEDKRLIFGNKTGEAMVEYDRWTARDVRFKLSIKESAATAAYQQRIIDMLNMLLERQAIDVLQYLDASPEPFAKQLALTIRTAQQENNLAALAQQNLTVPGADQQQVRNAERMMGMQTNNNFNNVQANG